MPLGKYIKLEILIMKIILKATISLFLSILLICMTGCNIFALDDNDLDINSVECIEMNLSTISKEYSQNPLRAEDTYINKYVVTSGIITDIKSDSIQISTSSYGVYSLRVYCEIKSTIPRDILLSLNKKDTISIKGKITSMFESTVGLAIYIDTYQIEILTAQNNL